MKLPNCVHFFCACIHYVPCVVNVILHCRLNGFEVVSCDGGSSIELFGPQGAGQEVSSWVEAIQSNIRCLNQREAQNMSDAICLDDVVSNMYVHVGMQHYY